jgi:hypothetical protein
MTIPSPAPIVSAASTSNHEALLAVPAYAAAWQAVVDAVRAGDPIVVLATWERYAAVRAALRAGRVA